MKTCSKWSIQYNYSGSKKLYKISAMYTVRCVANGNREVNKTTLCITLGRKPRRRQNTMVLWSRHVVAMGSNICNDFPTVYYTASSHWKCVVLYVCMLPYIVSSTVRVSMSGVVRGWRACLQRLLTAPRSVRILYLFIYLFYPWLFQRWVDGVHCCYLHAPLRIHQCCIWVSSYISQLLEGSMESFH